MDFMTRRSIRKYSQKQVEKDKIDDIIRVALTAPTGRNSRATHFIVVDNKEDIKELSQIREHGSQFVENAPLVIAVIGEKDKSTTILADCSIAAFAIQLKAHGLGLGSCWVHVHDRKSPNGKPCEDVIKEKFNVPSNYTVMCLIAIGYPEETKPAHELKEDDYKRVCYNTYKEN